MEYCPVLITGATGLLGREVLRAFHLAKHEAVGICFIRKRLHCVKIDITNKD